MLLHQTLKQSKLAAGAFALMLAVSESLSYGGACQSPTPSPCAADGVCRPSPNWGYSKTRWRSWPGDPAGQQQPTPADGTDPGGGGKHGLEPFELPLPQQEDLRGPAKNKDDKDEAADTPVGEFPGAGIPIPAEDPEQALPAFDPLGNQQQLPPMDDAPPALPNSLRQAGISLQAPTLPMSRLTNPATPKQSVRQANWQQTSSIQLINPASAIVTDAAEVPLQQAIYYEANGQSKTSPK